MSKTNRIFSTLTPPNNYTLVVPQNSLEWIIDSASNAHIPFKDRLRDYLRFNTHWTVIGLDARAARRVSALGSGKVTPTDKYGFKYITSDALHVPDSSSSILSLLKLKKSSLRFQFLGYGDGGDFRISANNSRFQMIWSDIALTISCTSPKDEFFAVTTSLGFGHLSFLRLRDWRFWDWERDSFLDDFGTRGGALLYAASWRHSAEDSWSWQAYGRWNREKSERMNVRWLGTWVLIDRVIWWERAVTSHNREMAGNFRVFLPRDERERERRRPERRARHVERLSRE